jgi:hypothetical protein
MIDKYALHELHNVSLKDAVELPKDGNLVVPIIGLVESAVAAAPVRHAQGLGRRFIQNRLDLGNLRLAARARSLLDSLGEAALDS